MTKQTGLLRVFRGSAALAVLLAYPATAKSQNPIPVLTSVSPGSFTPGSAAFALTVNGRSFIRSSIVRWNGADKRTQYVSANQLIAEITPEDASRARIPSITVFNPLPGGGTSGSASLAINSTTIDPAFHPNPVPALSTLSPSSIVVGNAQFVLVVNGSGFVPTSRIYWANSGERQTYYNSPSDVRITVPAEFVSVEGRKALVKVVNPTPGGGTSNQIEFRVACKVRRITSGGRYVVAGQPFQLTVAGENFGANDHLQLNGIDLTVSSRSSTSFVAPVPVELATPGNAALTVLDPCGTRSSPAIIHIWPAPAITSISPATVRAFDPPFNVSVNGNAFLGFAKVRVQGSDRPTTFVGPTLLTAAISESDLAQVRSVAITVFDPLLGVSSAATSLSVGYPVPLPTSLDPASIRSGGGGFTLTINGSRFYPASIVVWNGSERPTTYVSPTKLTVAISADDIQRTSPPSDRTVQVQVRTGNETSQPFSLTVTKQ
jgi:hypothetical protein